MQAYAIVFGSLLLVFGLLCVERTLVRRVRLQIPTRIIVLGTRGKSSVVRLIAYGLRAGGHMVMYKTTGSRPVLGNVDGTEQIIKRRSSPTPLEQRLVLRTAARQHADVAVIEAMSIRPESLRAEVQRILSPGIVVVTNVGRDHIIDIEDPCAAFASAIPHLAIAITSTTAPVELRERLKRRGIRIREVAPEAPGRATGFPMHEEWEENVQLALAACTAVGVPADTAVEGMNGVVADFGALTAWRVGAGSTRWITINAFAANDPDATRQVLQHALSRWGEGRMLLVGLLNLRRDRGDRTLQWSYSLCHDSWPFDRLVVTGHTPWYVRQSLRRTFGSRLVFATARESEYVMEAVTANAQDGGLVFGFGNIAGIGAALVDEWRKRGEKL